MIPAHSGTAPARVRVLIATRPVDFRRGADGSAATLQSLLRQDRFAGRSWTDLSKWFLAAYLMGRDKRGVSAKFLQRELAVAYQTAWTMAHKLRHGLSEDPG
jgi:hypothetical protein